MSAKGRSHDLAKSAFCAMPLFVAGAASVNLGSKLPFAARPHQTQKAHQFGGPFINSTVVIYTTRLICIRLISAIACAGFRPLGQVLAQFMIVWQR